MKRIAFLLALSLVGIATHLHYLFRPVDGVDVSDMAVSMPSAAERYEYHRHLKLLLAERDPDALKYLINANCGGGAGCYDHGRTLVQVLVKLGDPSFSGIIPQLHKEESGLLFNLLSAGYEYGGFSAFPDWEDFKDGFPLTFKALNEKV
jgi:hypothetical protein